MWTKLLIVGFYYLLHPYLHRNGKWTYSLIKSELGYLFDKDADLESIVELAFPSDLSHWKAKAKERMRRPTILFDFLPWREYARESTLHTASWTIYSLPLVRAGAGSAHPTNRCYFWADGRKAKPYIQGRPHLYSLSSTIISNKARKHITAAKTWGRPIERGRLSPLVGRYWSLRKVHPPVPGPATSLPYILYSPIFRS